MTDTSRLAPPRGLPTPLFALIAVASVLALALTNWLIAGYAPFGVKGIGASYLTLYYHVPAAAAMLLAYLFLGVCGGLYLATGHAVWDRCGRVSAGIGLLANGVVLVTGAVWGKAAWNVWWRFDDPRLTISAVVFLIYLGHVVLARGIEDEIRRPRLCAVYGLLATPSYPLVKYSIEWFGQGSHPPKVDLEGNELHATLAMAHVAFLLFYGTLWAWKYKMEAVRDRTANAMSRVRRLEEARS